ncbi:MAG: MerR family transcriptional regulator [Planctomycetota bacterium]|jgi:MerR family transcriptional regulator/heat shock protein HspR
MQKFKKSPLVQPLYTISVVSELTNVSPVMIREYEKAGMLRPPRVKGKRRFTQADVGNIKLLRYYLSERQMTLNGVKVLLETTPCYKIKMCKENGCPIFGTDNLACWKVASKDKGCDATLCPSCPIFLIRRVKKEFPPLPKDIPRVTG